jgi:ATP-dependent RNA circularization protein (DNA/RNA ligase family)
MKKYALFLLPLLLLLLIDSTNAYAEEETTYTVVIASLKNPENAQNLAQTMEKLGLKVQVLKMDTPIGEMHRICVDKAPTQEQAKNINADVHQKTGNESSWVLSIENYSEVVTCCEPTTQKTRQ